MSARRATFLAMGLAVTLVTSDWLAAADAPLCCRIFSIDATPILGADPAMCGVVPDADTTEEAAAGKRRATQCALAAQAEGRAFVYTYRELLSADIDLIVQALFGARGERLLLKTGRFGAEDVHMAEICATLTVLPDGKLRGDGCTSAHSYVERFRN